MTKTASDVVRKLRRLHSSIQARGRLDCRDAMLIGELLTIQKSLRRRGFLSWFTENEQELGFAYRTAARYMALYRANVANAGNNLADMPLIEAYEAAGIIKESIPGRDESRSEGAVEAVFAPADGLPQIEKRKTAAPHVCKVSRENWRGEIVALLSQEKLFDKILREGGLVITLK